MNSSKIDTEKHTVETMIRLYCRRKHGITSNGELCAECSELLEYAHRRLSKCRFGNSKPSCSRCPIHCYAPTKREKICHVMRYAGPRMICYHPMLTLQHMWDFIVSRCSKLF